MRKFYSLLFLLPLWLVSCNSDQQLAATQKLAKTGSQSAATMAAYYESLADIVSRQPALEIFYQTINPSLPRLTQPDFDLLDPQRVALLRRAKLAHDLQALYDALQKLSAYKTSDNVDKAVDNLTNSLALIEAEPPRLFGADLPTILKPAITSIANWRRSRNSQQAIRALQTTLQGMEQLVNSEADIYGLIQDRYFNLLKGKGGTTGIAVYLLVNQSMTIDFLLQQLPELRGLPWSSSPVQDPLVKTAMQGILLNHLSALETKSKGAAQAVANALKELTIEQQKLLDGSPLSLVTVLGYQQQVQTYIDLWRKYAAQK